MARCCQRLDPHGLVGASRSVPRDRGSTLAALMGVAVASDPTVHQSETASDRQLVLETRNTLDLSMDELLQLAAQLQEFIASNGISDLLVTVRGDEPLGAGNHWFDVLHIILPRAEVMKEDTFEGMIALAVAYMRSRFKRKHEGTRPRQVKVRTSNGQEVLEVTINSPDADPEFSAPVDDD